METILFYFFVVVTLCSGIIVVSTKNLIYAAYGMFLSFFGIAGMYVLLGAELIALFHLIIYIGGILILLLFGIMLTREMKQVSERKNKKEIVFGSVITGLFSGVLLFVVTFTDWKGTAAEGVSDEVFSGSAGSLPHYGFLLFNEHMLTFLIMGVFLLVVMIGAASLARK